MAIEISIRRRIVIFSFFILLFFLLLLLRLWNIQVVNGKDYANKAFEQRTLTISIQDIRGDILDRNGIPFTSSVDESYLILFPGLFHSDKELLPLIQYMTGMGEKDYSNLINARIPYLKRKIIHSTPEKEIEIANGEYPGVMIIRQRNRYDENSIARHVIGYLQKSDKIPMAGIEKKYNDYLYSGASEMICALSDAKNNIIPGVGYKILGTNREYYDIKLTLDYYIQKSLEDALDKYGGRGGGVVVKANTGDILALASRPNYYQNDIQKSLEVQDSFLNTPVEAFPPGSIFKVIVAAAGLESGKYNEHTVFNCNGGIDINGVYYSCHSATGGLGEISLREAFAHSCNDTFIKISSEIGGDKIIEMAERFGLGKPLNIGFDNASGNLPTKDYYAGAGIGNLAIGQGKVEVTPLQIADMITTIVNDGQRKKLSLLKEIVSHHDRTSNIIRNTDRRVRESQQVISSDTAKELREWMKDVTKYGTATLAQNNVIGGTGGKTGTPQISGDPYSLHYGWFAGFFPENHPQYVIVILSRENGQGGKIPALIFNDVAQAIWQYDMKLIEK